MLVLASYSTIFSGLWLFLACVKPRYGQLITTNGRLPYSTASLLCAFLAKSIEVSYVAVFVAYLGQTLSKRAIAQKSKGITIAEMSMRLWITQPGTMFTHWETVRYAALSFLGGFSLLVATMAMLYTTASDTLGQWDFLPLSQTLSLQGLALWSCIGHKLVKRFCAVHFLKYISFGCCVL